MKKIALFATGSLMIFQALPLVVFADEVSTSESGTGGMRQEIQDKRDALRNQIQQERKTVTQGVMQKRDALKQEFQSRRTALNDEMKQKREAMETEFKARRDVLMQDIKQKREVFKEEAEKRKEELKKKLGEKRAAEMEKFFNAMVRKFENAMDRLNDLADRISARLDMAAANGRDVVALRDQLTNARQVIADAQKSFEAAKTEYANAIKNTDVKTAFADIKKLVADVAVKIKAAHAVLVDVVNSIKGLGGGTIKPPMSTTTPVLTPTATSTPATIPTNP